MTLVIMAAGMGSRFGGLKQIEPMDEYGNFIIDYSIYDAIRNGYDKVVFIIKKENYDIFRDTIGKRIENKIISFFKSQFYKIMSNSTGMKLKNGASDFRLLNRKVIDTVLTLSEHDRFSKGIFSWVGYNTKWLEYKNVERVAGSTKWSFMKLFKYSIDSIVAFSTFPLVLPVIVSVILAFITFIMFIMMLINNNEMLQISTLIMFVASLNTLFIGIIGIYLSKMHVELQDRPKYIIKLSNIKRK